MIVIGIIGILAASLYPSLTSYLARGRDTAKIAEIKQINTAILSYQTDKSTYKVAGAGIFGTGFGWMSITNGAYLKSILNWLAELWYLPLMRQDTDWLANPIGYTASPCWWAIHPKHLYLFYFDDSTWQYSISGYLENPKESDIANIQLTYNAMGNIAIPFLWLGEGSCNKYGRNYAVGQN